MKRIFMTGVLLVVATVVFANEPLPQKIFSHPTMDADWQQLYDGIKGDGFDEKANNARTNWEVKAIAEKQLCTKWQELDRIGFQLWEKLPKTLSGMPGNPKDDFLVAHQAWLDYIKEQAAFLANTFGGGSGYPLYYRSVLIDEINWRIRLYQDLLNGKNAVKDSLYFYGCNPAGF